MATLRGQGASTYDIGEAPPFVNWTIVKGDTASFKIYLTDDTKQPLNIPDWTIEHMRAKLPIGEVQDYQSLKEELTRGQVPCKLIL